jgi:hypothetical protein
MAINATYVASVTLLGSGIGSGGGPFVADTQQTTPTNPNAPAPAAAQLAVGTNTILVPSGFTVARAMLLPPAGSTNAKTLKGVTGDTGFTGWYGGSMTIPVIAGGTFVIVSTNAGEEVVIAYS